MKERYIAHVDMDAFFAAVEQRDNPDLKGRPVVIGADPNGGKGRGVVSTCSYEARAYGIHSAMPISKAYKLCPDAAYLYPDMEKYAVVSGEVLDIFYNFTPEIEPISIDEAFLDITGSYHLFGTPRETCLKIKSRIKEGTGLTASIGLAPTMMAAKIASDLQKPDGLVEVTAEGLLGFLRPLPIKKLWGLGPKSEQALNAAGILTIGDIADADEDHLIGLFGKNGYHFRRLANGIDEREVESGDEAKSVSNEETFDEDTADEALIKGTLLYLSEKVGDRLRNDGIKGRTVTLKIRLEGFKTYTRAKTLWGPTNFDDEIFKVVTALYSDFNRGGRRVRLLGVRASNLSEKDFPKDLFAGTRNEKSERIHKAIDRIKRRFGRGAIHRPR